MLFTFSAVINDALVNGLAVVSRHALAQISEIDLRLSALVRGIHFVLRPTHDGDDVWLAAFVARILMEEREILGFAKFLSVIHLSGFWWQNALFVVKYGDWGIHLIASKWLLVLNLI